MPDIFISYAHVDNQPPFGMEHGWITHFVIDLKVNLSRRMGRDEKYRVWMDFKLQGNDELTPQLKEQLKTVDTLLLFLSPGWLSSKWCQWELETFLDQPSDKRGRIFVIELEKLDPSWKKPEALNDMLEYRFWQETHDEKLRILGYPVPSKEDKEYFRQVLDLSVQLARQLITPIQQSQNQSLPAPKATVYVPPVGESLSQQRIDLISGLSQYEIEVLPRSNSLDLYHFKENMEKDLAHCCHFVQLLDEHSERNVPYDQYLLAKSSKKLISQWRSSTLDYSKADPQQKQLLENEHVIATSLTDFIRQVREKVLAKPEEKTAEADEQIQSGRKKMVFIHTGPPDMELARKIADCLRQKGYGIALPRYNGDPSQIRKTIERRIQSCDVMLLLQQITPLDAIEDYLVDAITQTHDRQTALPILICRQPQAEQLDFIPPETSIFECKKSFDQECLEQFLAAVAG